MQSLPSIKVTEVEGNKDAHKYDQHLDIGHGQHGLQDNGECQQHPNQENRNSESSMNDRNSRLHRGSLPRIDFHDTRDGHHDRQEDPSVEDKWQNKTNEPMPNFTRSKSYQEQRRSITPDPVNSSHVPFNYLNPASLQVQKSSSDSKIYDMMKDDSGVKSDEGEDDDINGEKRKSVKDENESYRFENDINDFYQNQRHVMTPAIIVNEDKKEDEEVKEDHDSGRGSEAASTVVNLDR